MGKGGGGGRKREKEKENRKGIGEGQSLFTSKGFLMCCFYLVFPLISMVTGVHYMSHACFLISA